MRNAPAGRSVVVVVGRSNYAAHSPLMESLITDLQATGHEVYRFQSTNQLLAERFESSRIAGFCRRHESIRVPLKHAAKVAILLRWPSRWDYFAEVIKPHRNGGRGSRTDLRRLRKLLRTTNATRLCLLSHSAGGILASLLASDHAVTRLVCIGYPFKNPDRADERYRTAHLPTVAKPFLILQGDQDHYGTAEDAAQYELSPSTIVVPITADHDYSNLEASEYRACRDLLMRWTS